MTNEEIAKIVNEALADEFELEAEDLRPDAHIRDDLGLDSLDIVDMVIVIEKAFAFKLPDRALLANIHTLGDIYGLIANLRDVGTISK